MVSPKLEMRRSAGKLAVFLAGVYLLVLLSLVVSTATGKPIPLIGWPIALVPGAAFVYSSVDAVKLHQTTDEDDSKKQWRRSLSYAAIGSALLIAAVVIIHRITPV